MRTTDRAVGEESSDIEQAAASEGFSRRTLLKADAGSGVAAWSGCMQTEEFPQSGIELSDHSRTSRRSFMKITGAVLASLASGIGITRNVKAQSVGPIPTGPILYDVPIVGETAYGSFSRTAKLYVFPALDTTGASGNGVNVRDIGLFSGNPGGNPEMGAIWFTTNNGLYDRVGLQTTTGRALIDVATVTADQSTGLLTVDIDPSVAPTVQLNSMNARGGLTAGVYQLVDGVMLLQFTPRGQLAGLAVDFVANGYIEPGLTPYRAGFIAQ